MPSLYLDHAATTPPLPEALDAFLDAARDAYANPGSLHQAGADAARALERARRALREALGARRYRVVWTATGTESNHLGIQGLARACRGPARQAAQRLHGGDARPRVLVGAIEHPSSRLAARALAQEGYEVAEIPADSAGIVRPGALAPLLGEDVALVSVHWANNEIGALQPVADLVARTRAAAPHAAFHCDAVQAAGKRPEPVDALGADAVAVAAHKLGGVRGCAALLLHEDAPVPRPLFVGGGHEGGLRSGTENVAGAAAFAAAARARRARMDEDPRHLLELRARALERLRAVRPDLQVLGPVDEDEILGSVLTVAVPGVRAETFLHVMESHGVLVGSGSACHAHGSTESPVLAAIGVPAELRDGVLRLSFSGAESDADLDRMAGAFAQASAQFVG